NNLANAQSSVYTYHVQGSFYHRIGSLLPENDIDSRFLQMYVWDTQHELDYRMNIIPNIGLNPALIQSLKTILPTENIANLAMLIHADILGLDLKTFNAPTASQIAAI
ncbi:9138_t:CDS:2, partial [Gigaspora margarita]